MAGLVRRGAVITAATVASLIGVGVVGRFAAETDAGRSAITVLLDGLDLGPAGHLRIAGLHGDPFGRFVIDRLSVRDAKGAWLEAAGLQVAWRPADLLQSRLHILRAGVTALSLHRAPDLGPAKPASPQDLDLVIDQAVARVELGADLAGRQGVYDLTGRANLARSGDQEMSLKAVSRLHPGDFLEAQFDSRKGRSFALTAEALEAQGGQILATNRSGGGALFTIRLPQTESPPPVEIFP